MSQFSQISVVSEGGFSDIISDVDQFIEEHGMTNDVGNLLAEIPNGNEEFVNENVEEVEYKPAPPGFFGAPCQPVDATLNDGFPPEQPSDLCNDEYPGPFNFEVFIIPNEQKTPWEYSPKLNKIFIGINLKFPVAFSVKSRPKMNLFVRATPVYSQAQNFQTPVHRCVGHQHAQDPSNKGLPEHVCQHIIRCSNNAVKYCGRKAEGSRLSLVLPLSNPQAGTDLIREFFHFVCKNSCPLGMNRRPIEVVFSLEGESGEVLGRRVVAVRVCSCPKRDREKEEKDLEKNAKAGPAPQSKKRKMAPSSDSPDTRIYSINVMGKTFHTKVLQFYQALLAQEVVTLEGNGKTAATFRKAMDEVNAILNKS